VCACSGAWFLQKTALPSYFVLRSSVRIMADLSPPYSPHSPSTSETCDPPSPRSDSSPLDLRTSTAVESLLSLRGSCGASGSTRMECQWRPPSPAPSTSSERSVAPGASPVRQDATTTPQPSSVRPAFQPPSSASHLYSPPPLSLPPLGGFTLGPDGRVVNSYLQPSLSPPSIVSLYLPLCSWGV
jgi:hypothetical protein